MSAHPPLTDSVLENVLIFAVDRGKLKLLNKFVNSLVVALLLIVTYDTLSPLTVVSPISLNVGISADELPCIGFKVPGLIVLNNLLLTPTPSAILSLVLPLI